MNEKKLAKLNLFVSVIFACGAVLAHRFNASIIILRVLQFMFHILTYHIEGHYHCENNITNTNTIITS